jgi:hypothetical protein
MQALAKRRKAALLAEEKTQVIEKIFRLARAGGNDQERPPEPLGNAGEQIRARAALHPLNSFAAAPATAEKLLESVAEWKVGH